jgi:hypothetical protein
VLETEDADLNNLRSFYGIVLKLINPSTCYDLYTMDSFDRQIQQAALDLRVRD